MLKLSVLDQSPIREGGTAAQAIRETLALARAVDALGYHRFWLAEHHNTSGLASAAPEVLIPLVAAQTSRLRVGSGGVMLTHYSAYKVAEVFRTLEAMYPGRIDLGLGRAPGSGHRPALALARGGSRMSLEHYPQQIFDLLGYLGDDLPDDHPFHDIRATPVAETMPAVWLLGSSAESAMLAGEMGLAYSHAHFINAATTAQSLEIYRRCFRPSPWLAQPQVSLGVSAVCAPTEEEAIRLSWSRYCWRFRHGAVPSVETALAFEYSPAELDYIEYSRPRAAIGDPQQVSEKLKTLATEFEADELVLLTITYDFVHRVRSYRLIAEALALEPAPPATVV